MISARRDGEVARVTIDRPEKRNSMTRRMWCDLGDAVEEAATSGARVLVITGRGEHFCAGADIGEFAGGRGEDYDRDNRRAEEAIASFPGPSVAAIAGSCVGGGVSIAIACDVRIAASDARFGVTPAKLGIVYPSNALERLVGVVGPSAAKRLIFTAAIVGLVWHFARTASGKGGNRAMPYGPSLAVATGLVVLGKPFFEWLLGRLMGQPIALP